MSNEIRTSLTRDLQSRSPHWCASKWVLEATPFIFAGAAELHWQWKSDLASALEVDPKDIVITGSGAAGVSLSPYKAMASFSARSDIDVAVVSSYHFDSSWRCLRNLGTKLFDLSVEERAAVAEHVRRFIYWGTIATDQLLSIFPFGSQSLDALEHMSEKSPSKGRDIKARIYKDYGALRSYLEMGLRDLRDRSLAANQVENDPIPDDPIV